MDSNVVIGFYSYVRPCIVLNLSMCTVADVHVYCICIRDVQCVYCTCIFTVVYSVYCICMCSCCYTVCPCGIEV